MSRVEVTVERFVPGGWGMGRDADGLVFVRGAAHGERVRGKVVKKKGQVRFAVVDEVVERKPGRAEPDCDAHPVCGGCTMLDLTPPAELKAKGEILHDALTRLAKLGESEMATVKPMVSAPLRAGARRRASFVIDERGTPAFHTELSNQTVPRGACAALAAPLEGVLAAMHEMAPWPAGARVAVAVDGSGRRSATVSEGPARQLSRMAERLVRRGVVDGAIAMAGQGRAAGVEGEPALFGVVAPGVRGGPYQSDSSTFTQSSDYGALTIMNEVVAAAKLLRMDRGLLLELYAGSGHLTLALAAEGAEVMAVESDRSAITWLRSNAARSPMASRIEVVEYFVRGDNVQEFAALKRFDGLVLDPPRAGVQGFKALLESCAPKGLVMVSCDVATGARDLRIALDQGYKLKSLVPIDAFPRTYHLEWVAALSK